MARNDGVPENQHYVPKMLLRGFVSDPKEKEQVFVYDKHELHSFHTNIINIVSERNFYELGPDDDPGSIESLLSEMETKAEIAIATIVESEDLSKLVDGQSTWLLMFVAAQFLRTRHMREVFRTIADGALERAKSMGFDHEEGMALSHEDEIKRGTILGLLGNLEAYTNLLSDKVCFLMTTSTDRPFTISDHPVVMHNERDLSPYGNIGVGVPGIQIYLPLTSTILIALWCPTLADELLEATVVAGNSIEELEAARDTHKDIDKNEVDNLISKWQANLKKTDPLVDVMRTGSAVQASPENVAFLNHLQVKWSHRFVMSSKDDFSLANEMISDNVKFRGGFLPKIN